MAVTGRDTGYTVAIRIFSPCHCTILYEATGRRQQVYFPKHCADRRVPGIDAITNVNGENARAASSCGALESRFAISSAGRFRRKLRMSPFRRICRLRPELCLCPGHAFHGHKLVAIWASLPVSLAGRRPTLTTRETAPLGLRRQGQRPQATGQEGGPHARRSLSACHSPLSSLRRLCWAVCVMLGLDRSGLWQTYITTAAAAQGTAARSGVCRLREAQSRWGRVLRASSTSPGSSSA